MAGSEKMHVAPDADEFEAWRNSIDPDSVLQRAIRLAYSRTIKNGVSIVLGDRTIRLSNNKLTLEIPRDVRNVSLNVIALAHMILDHAEGNLAEA